MRRIYEFPCLFNGAQSFHKHPQFNSYHLSHPPTNYYAFYIKICEIDQRQPSTIVTNVLRNSGGM